MVVYEDLDFGSCVCVSALWYGGLDSGSFVGGWLPNSLAGLFPSERDLLVWRMWVSCQEVAGLRFAYQIDIGALAVSPVSW